MDWQALIQNITVLLAGVLGVCLLLAWNVYVRKTQEKALLQTFIQEFLLLYKRCAMYYYQMNKGSISYSTLFEISDAGMVAKLAEVTNEPPVIETVMKLKADFFQVIRWAHMMSKEVKTTIWRTEPDPNNSNGKIRIKETTTVSAPNRDAQSKAMVFFVGEATSEANFRERHRDYRDKICALLAHLEVLNSKCDYGYIPLIIDRVRGRTKALKKFIDDTRISLDESLTEIEEVRETEKKRLFNNHKKKEKEKYLEEIIDKWCAIGLREALGKLSQICSGGKVQDQIECIQFLKTKHPHRIELWKEIPDGPSDFRKSDADTQFNCFMFCLDIRYGDIKEMIGSDGRRIPNSEYMSFLCKGYMTEKIGKSPNNGDYVLYFSDQKIVHAGKMESGRVLSKWGSGHVWIHGIFEVPVAYGNQVKYFNKIDKNICIEAFCEWIKEGSI